MNVPKNENKNVEMLYIVKAGTEDEDNYALVLKKKSGEVFVIAAIVGEEAKGFMMGLIQAAQKGLQTKLSLN